MIKLSVIDSSVLGTLVERITGHRGPEISDTTIFLFQDGSVCNTMPATPDKFRGHELFKGIRHLPPTKRFNGRMLVHRQGGDVKGIEFVTD
jgi:hypothetical protein